MFQVSVDMVWYWIVYACNFAVAILCCLLYMIINTDSVNMLCKNEIQ